MTFDLNNINQFSSAMDKHFFLPFYANLHQKAEKHRFIFLTSPFIGIADGIASLVQTVGAIAEAAIKGLINIFQGTITFDSSPLKKGSLQLILGVGIIGIFSIPIIIFRVLRISIKMMIDPKLTCDQQERNYREKFGFQQKYF